tara:strand:- start:4458 stop:5177 length:720 start_codon:yes stop_codon:yes gene_type:complete
VAFTPPNTFVDGSIVTAADMQGNDQALRVYLHRGIAAGDFEATKWIETRHVQPPRFDPFQGMQHGVTGHQGGQWAGGVQIRLAFATKYLSGNGRPTNDSFHQIPQTAVTVDIRQPAFVLYHYWYELENGKDFSTAAYQVAEAQRRVYVIPYVGDFTNANVYNERARGQETRNAAIGIPLSYPIGMERPFVLVAGYGAKQGTVAVDRSVVAPMSFGLAAHSLSDRCGVVNWGFALEVFYF